VTLDAKCRIDCPNKEIDISASVPDDNSTRQAQILLASFSSGFAPLDQPEQTAAKEELLGSAGK
jgi:hypothetical protein